MILVSWRRTLWLRCWRKVLLTGKELVLFIRLFSPTQKLWTPSTSYCFLPILEKRPTAEQGLQLPWLISQVGSITTQSITLRRGLRGAEFSKYLGMKKLKKHALGYIASNLTQEQVGNLGEIFKTIDEGNDGVLTLNELDHAIEEGTVFQPCGANSFYCLLSTRSSPRSILLRRTFPSKHPSRSEGTSWQAITVGRRHAELERLSRWHNRQDFGHARR